MRAGRVDERAPVVVAGHAVERADVHDPVREVVRALRDELLCVRQRLAPVLQFLVPRDEPVAAVLGERAAPARVLERRDRLVAQVEPGPEVLGRVAQTSGRLLVLGDHLACDAREVLGLLRPETVIVAVVEVPAVLLLGDEVALQLAQDDRQQTRTQRAERS